MRGRTYKFEAHGISSSHPFKIYMNGSFVNSSNNTSTGITGTGSSITITIPNELALLSGSEPILIGEINGDAAYDYSGISVSSNGDGTIVAIGASGNNGRGSDSGHVKIYQYNGSSWTQLGEDIDGEAAYDEFGWSVSLSDDGTIIAIGSENSNHVKIYQWDGISWTQLSDIEGEAEGDDFGICVSLNNDGTRVFIGGRYNDENGTDSGHVKIYEFNEMYYQCGVHNGMKIVCFLQ